MKRCIAPLSRCPPAPRRPSSSTVPVMRVSGPASSPVGWNCTISMSRSGSAEAQRHGEAVHALVAGRRVIAIHGRAAAGGEQHRLRTDEAKFARAHVDHQHAGERAVWRRDQRDGAMLLKAADRPRPDLLHQPVDDLDAGEVALVHGAIEGLAGEGLAVQRAVGIAVEETADLVFQLAHALDGLGHQRPGQLLMRQPFAAFDGVHEMALDRSRRD